MSRQYATYKVVIKSAKASINHQGGWRNPISINKSWLLKKRKSYIYPYVAAAACMVNYAVVFLWNLYSTSVILAPKEYCSDKVCLKLAL